MWHSAIVFLETLMLAQIYDGWADSQRINSRTVWVIKSMRM